MIFSGSDKIFKGTPKGEPFIVPLAIPLIAGPSAMAMVILMMARQPEKWLSWLISLVCAWFISGIFLLSSDKISKLLGEKGLAAIEKLMGMLLTTIAVQMFIDGIQLLIDK